MTTKASDQKHNGQGANLSADNELPGLCRELAEIRARQKADKLRAKDIADQIRDKLGPENWYAVIDGWEIFRLDVDHREIVVPAGTWHQIRLKDRR